MPQDYVLLLKVIETISYMWTLYLQGQVAWYYDSYFLAQGSV